MSWTGATVTRLPAPCWLIDHDAWGVEHYPTRGEAERAAARGAVEDANPPVWPVRAGAVCWTARCACGDGLLTGWEAAEFDDPPTAPLHRDSEADARGVLRVTGGRCPACWSVAMSTAAGWRLVADRRWCSTSLSPADRLADRLAQRRIGVARRPPGPAYLVELALLERTARIARVVPAGDVLPGAYVFTTNHGDSDAWEMLAAVERHGQHCVALTRADPVTGEPSCGFLTAATRVYVLTAAQARQVGLASPPSPPPVGACGGEQR